MTLNKVVLKVFLPNNKFSRTHTHTAPRGKRFTSVAIETIMTNIVSKMEAQFPGTKYKAVRLRGQQFNIVCTERPQPLYAPQEESAGAAH